MTSYPWMTPELLKKAQRCIAKHGAKELTQAYLLGHQSGRSPQWTILDTTVMALLVLTPIPGTSLLAPLYRAYRMHGIPDDRPWTLMSYPLLRLEEDEAAGFIDEDPVPLLITTDDKSLEQQSVNDHHGWIEKSKTFLIHNSHVESKVLKPLPVTVAPVFAASFDAYREIPELDIHAHALGQALNPIASMPTEKVFTGKITGDFTQVPVNARGNNVKMRTVNRLTTSNGLHYQAPDKTQVLQTAATRYAVAQKQYVLDQEGRDLADEIASNMYEKIIDKERLQAAWTDVAQSTVYNGWLKKSKDSGYSSSHSLLAEEDDRILRFQGKGNFKAKEDLLSLKGIRKAPQGILAWSKGANSFFGYASRMISEVTRLSLKDEVTWNNGLSVEAAARRFVKATLKVPCVTNVRLDAVEMDSKQNEFTHLIVRLFMEKLFVSCEFLDLYFSMMADYQVTNPDLKMFLKWVKASGEPLTLYGNSFLMTAMTLYLIDGEGPYALFTQGDDVDLNQANMRVNEFRLARIALYCDFVAEMEFGDFAAFCGFVLDNGLLVPNIRRKLIKLSGMSYISQKHFEMVQISMREWCKQLKQHIGFSDIIQVNANTYGVDYEVAEGWFEVIDSLSHISASQFALACHKVDLNPAFLAQDKNTGKHDFLESVY